MLPRVWPLLLLVAALLVPALPAHAAPGDPTQVDRWVDATLDLAQPTVNELDISGVLHIHKYPVDAPGGGGSSVYTAADMSAAYTGANKFGGNTGAAFLEDARDA